MIYILLYNTPHFSIKQWKQSTLIRINPSLEDCQVPQPHHVALRMGGRDALVAIDKLLKTGSDTDETVCHFDT